jgi:hypothetical protein
MNKIIKKINKWINKNNFKLNIAKNLISEVNFDTKIININKNTKILKQIIIILHECGHILIYLHRKKYKCNIIAGLSWNKWCKLFNSKNSLRKKILILEEEIEAWNRGKKLAERLNIKINNKIYEYYKIKCLMTYIRTCSIQK